MITVKVCIKLRAIFEYDSDDDLEMMRFGDFAAVPRAGDWVAFGVHDSQVVEEVMLYDGGKTEVWLGPDNGMAISFGSGQVAVDTEGLQDLAADYVDRGWDNYEE